MKTELLQSETPLWLLLICQVLLHDFSISLDDSLLAVSELAENMSLLEVSKLRSSRWKQHMRRSKLFESVL